MIVLLVCVAAVIGLFVGRWWGRVDEQVRWMSSWYAEEEPVAYAGFRFRVVSITDLAELEAKPHFIACPAADPRLTYAYPHGLQTTR